MTYLRKSLFSVMACIVLMSLTASVALAQDPEQGKRLWEEVVWQCSACHGGQGEGVFGSSLAGKWQLAEGDHHETNTEGTKNDDDHDHEHSIEAWIEQVRQPRRRMPAFSEDQASDEQLLDMLAYISTLEESEPGFQRIELTEDAHPGQALVIEKRCVACHSPTGLANTRFPSGDATPSVEALIRQLRTPFKAMPSYSEQQVSDEEAALIIEFLQGQLDGSLQDESISAEDDAQHQDDDDASHHDDDDADQASDDHHHDDDDHHGEATASDATASFLISFLVGLAQFFLP